MITTKVSRWGHSLGIRLPKNIAEEAGLNLETLLEIQSLEGGKILLSRTSPKEETLDELLSRVTPENIHHEIDFGPARGHEVW